MNLLRILSYGGGVQSNALMVLVAQGLVQVDYVVFANVGENAENPDTLTYIENYAKPYMQESGINYVEVRKKDMRGNPVDLYDFAMRPNRTIPLPVKLPSGAYGRRGCTTDFKIRQIDKFAKSKGATRWISNLGISTDEMTRMRSEQWQPVGINPAKLTDIEALLKWIYWRRVAYPLIDLRLSRSMCQKLVQQAGLPLPPKSSCFFCPFHSRTVWTELKRKRPDLFDRSVELEDTLNAKFDTMKTKRNPNDKISLHTSGMPLRQAVGNQLSLFSDDELDACESGYCMV